MIKEIPEELWKRENLKILDPCAGNGNFFVPIFYKLKEERSHLGIPPQKTNSPSLIEDKNIKKEILSSILYFNDINESRTNNIKKVFKSNQYNLNITNLDFLSGEQIRIPTGEIVPKAPKAVKVGHKPLASVPNSREGTDAHILGEFLRGDGGGFDLIVANPPYAKLLKSGRRASKNHNMIGLFIEAALGLLKKEGYILFIIPDNWMSKSDRNKLIEKLTSLQIIYLNLYTAKEYFPSIGSSFTWFIIQKKPASASIPIKVEGLWNKRNYSSLVNSRTRKFIPQFFNRIVDSICLKTLENEELPKFQIETTSYLHRYTKSSFISKGNDEIHKYRLIHTPTQTVYSSKPHKWQEGYKVFISTTSTYKTFIDDCGMTQSIAFIRCKTKQEAQLYKNILDHDLYKFLNNICRWLPALVPSLLVLPVILFT